jgi:phenylpropionate dioxygenase-like ring-hydroxylating dioxygenase large terminal subunit
MSSVPNTKSEAAEGRSSTSYAGYYKRAIPAEDGALTHSGPGTALGEYLRCFWQPVCLAAQLGRVPLPVRIMGEDLVVFRDKRGRVGILHRNCCHRGASLEYGVIQESGIRCCYHGIHYDIDGTILDVPAERDRGKRRAQTLSQGAYPAIERDGLIFAYMGPPDKRPPFPEYDAFDKSDDTRLMPFSNSFPCNWLQVLDNIADQIHTSFLHNVPFLFGGKAPEDIDWEKFTLSNFATVPLMDYVEVRGGTAMSFIASRRVDDQKVWFRIQDCIVPNMTEHAYLYENGSQRRLFHRVHMARWYVPVDDTHSVIYGWRMFGREIDPFQKGTESAVGLESMDFLGGQVGDRSYEEGQRLPGDWEAIKSQRPIAIHALENPVESDIGVYMFRKLLRDAISGRNPSATPEAMNAPAHRGDPYYCYTQNDILELPRRPSEDEDRAMIKRVGRRIVQITAEADGLAGAERQRFIITGLEELERSAATL